VFLRGVHCLKKNKNKKTRNLKFCWTGDRIQNEVGPLRDKITNIFKWLSALYVYQRSNGRASQICPHQVISAALYSLLLYFLIFLWFHTSIFYGSLFECSDSNDQLLLMRSHKYELTLWTMHCTTGKWACPLFSACSNELEAKSKWVIWSAPRASKCIRYLPFVIFRRQCVIANS
jgi:hypothetical protein